VNGVRDFEMKSKKIKKIYILGASGGGKSYLANEISKILKIPSYDIDDVRFIKKYTKARTKKQRKILIDRILKKSKWILDARGTDWDRHAMKKADLIIWLKTPFPKRTFRILKRSFKRRNQRNLDETFLGVLSLIKYSGSYRFGKKPTSFKENKRFIKENNIEVVSIENNRQLKKFLEKLK